MGFTGDASRSIGAVFESQPNAFNFLRFCLAAEVVIWHAYSLRGDNALPLPVARVVAEIGVDGFFAISGFLICRSWDRRRKVGQFLAARARRIFPGLWTCLLVTAFVIVPLAVTLQGRAVPHPSALWQYVAGNADGWASEFAIAGSPFGLSDPGWNGSLWTLGYELDCYIAVAVLGAVSLMRPLVFAGIATACWALALVIVLEHPFAIGGIPWAACRLGLMFCCGALLWFGRNAFPVSSRWAAIAVASLALGALTPCYRLVAAPGVAYLCLYLAITLGRNSALVLRHDLSYGTYIYAFPIQQSLLLAGFGATWLGFAALSFGAVAPFATLSWFLIERPAQRFGSRSQLLVDSRPTSSGAGFTSA